MASPQEEEAPTAVPTPTDLPQEDGQHAPKKVGVEDEEKEIPLGGDLGTYFSNAAFRRIELIQTTDEIRRGKVVAKPGEDEKEEAKDEEVEAGPESAEDPVAPLATEFEKLMAQEKSPEELMREHLGDDVEVYVAPHMKEADDETLVTAVAVDNDDKEEIDRGDKLYARGRHGMRTKRKIRRGGEVFIDHACLFVGDKESAEDLEKRGGAGSGTPGLAAAQFDPALTLARHAIVERKMRIPVGITELFVPPVDRVSLPANTLTFFARHVKDDPTAAACDIDFEQFCMMVRLIRANMISCGHPTGHGVFISVATIDHSCTPNVHVSASGPIARVVALRDIDEGEVLFVARTDLLSSIHERRYDIATQFGMLCTCETCTFGLDSTRSFWCEHCGPSFKDQITGDKRPVEADAESPTDAPEAVEGTAAAATTTTTTKTKTQVKAEIVRVHTEKMLKQQQQQQQQQEEIVGTGSLGKLRMPGVEDDPTLALKPDLLEILLKSGRVFPTVWTCTSCAKRATDAYQKACLATERVIKTADPAILNICGYVDRGRIHPTHNQVVLAFRTQEKIYVRERAELEAFCKEKAKTRKNTKKQVKGKQQQQQQQQQHNSKKPTVGAPSVDPEADRRAAMDAKMDTAAESLRETQRMEKMFWSKSVHGAGYQTDMSDPVVRHGYTTATIAAARLYISNPSPLLATLHMDRGLLRTSKVFSTVSGNFRASEEEQEALNRIAGDGASRAAHNDFQAAMLQFAFLDGRHSASAQIANAYAHDPYTSNPGIRPLDFTVEQILDRCGIDLDSERGKLKPEEPKEPSKEPSKEEEKPKDAGVTIGTKRYIVDGDVTDIDTEGVIIYKEEEEDIEDLGFPKPDENNIIVCEEADYLDK
jgi:hypothetical protein